MRISKRLETVASFVPEGCRLADVGTDHAYIPIYLMLQHRIKHAVAMDIGHGPLARAQAHIGQYRLSEQIETRLSDGLDKLHADEADTVVIAGMGGELIIHIMAAGRHVWDGVKTWVLSPQSELYKVRLYLQQQGFYIKEETMLIEEGKYYTVMRVQSDPPGAGGEDFLCETKKTQSDIELRYGSYLLRTGHPVLRSFLEKEMRQTEAILQGLREQDTMGSRARQEALMLEYAQMKEAYNEVQ